MVPAVSAPTFREMRAALDVVAALAEVIREVGSIPSGHLYAQVMGQLSIGQYERIVGLLKRAGVIEERGHVLTWVGPALEKTPGAAVSS